MSMTDTEWNRIVFFKKAEFNCSATGKNHMDYDFMEKLDELRYTCGFPFAITSGYRDPLHPAEIKKRTKGGTHTLGIAADIRVTNGAERRIIVENAIKLGFNGIGVAKDFIHVDTRITDIPVIWTY